MKINVTNEDIKKGTCRSPWGCPVALAIKRAVGKRAENVTIGIYYVHATPSFKSARLPAKVIQFIYDFDCMRDVKPIKFDLNLEAIK